MPNEKNVFEGLDEVIQTRISSVIYVRNQSFPTEWIEKKTITVKLKKDEKMGISVRTGMVVKVNYDSVVKGTMFTGDIIILINDTLATFDEIKDPKIPGNRKAKEFAPLIQSFYGSGGKFELSFIRMKSRFEATLPPTIQGIEGHNVETVILYQYKFLPLGLNIQQSDRIIVNYTLPDTAANICFNIGESILMIDNQPVTSLKEVKIQVITSCYRYGYAKVLVDYPTTDLLKNGIRAKLTTAAKNGDRPMYAICEDAQQFANEGIKILKNCKEPESILPQPPARNNNCSEGGMTERTQETKTVLENSGKEKKKKKTSVVKKLTNLFSKKHDKLSFNEKTGEHDIPSEWNSKLFVVLPPLKTVETETGKPRQGVTKYESPAGEKKK